MVDDDALHMSSADQAAIDKLGAAWTAAHNAGNTAGMQAAHDAATVIRMKYASNQTVVHIDYATGSKQTLSNEATYVDRSAIAPNNVIATVATMGGGILANTVKTALTKTAGKELGNLTTQLYRAMSEEEYSSLMKAGKFEPFEKAMEGKWFATTAEDAAQWGKTFYPKGNYKVVKVTVPKNALDGMYFGGKNLDGIGPAYYAERDFINQMMLSLKEVF
jgi:hypothetical protein